MKGQLGSLGTERVTSNKKEQVTPSNRTGRGSWMTCQDWGLETGVSETTSAPTSRPYTFRDWPTLTRPGTGTTGPVTTRCQRTTRTPCPVPPSSPPSCRVGGSGRDGRTALSADRG